MKTSRSSLCPRSQGWHFGQGAGCEPLTAIPVLGWKDCRPVPVAAPARVAPVAPVAPVASAVGRLSVDRASTAQCRAPTPGPKMGVNAVVHGFDPGQKVKEDDWSAATTSVGCADAVSSATSSIPVKGGYGHRPSPPTSGQPRRPSGTGMGQAMDSGDITHEFV
ncbi:unnamed protein product [Cladocopium goreaui]|uniref:Uncharacterized protein n=1 Tax=Cladocopium goreaui TaxID=2562237 RepID=A0A9P1FV68_9DINO|nr:unnamed protein product [Cladocopium goreaui]